MACSLSLAPLASLDHWRGRSTAAPFRRARWTSAEVGRLIKIGLCPGNGFDLSFRPNAGDRLLALFRPCRTYVFRRRGWATATAPVQFGCGPHGKLPAGQTHIATLVVAGDARRATPCSSPGCAPMYSRHAARSGRPSNLRLCLINRQHNARCFGGFDRYWQCAKNRSGRSHRAGKHVFFVKSHHGLLSFWDARFFGNKKMLGCRTLGRTPSRGGELNQLIRKGSKQWSQK